MANAVKTTKTACTSDIQKACTASTGKGNYRRLQAQADSEERAIPPDGFTKFSLGQCCRIRQSLNGRTMFAPTVRLIERERVDEGIDPYRFTFSRKQNNSSALSGISSKRGDILLGKRRIITSTIRTRVNQKATSQVPAKATISVCSPRRTARNERFRRTVSRSFP